eukprot:ctg_1122.g373
MGARACPAPRRPRQWLSPGATAGGGVDSPWRADDGMHGFRKNADGSSRLPPPTTPQSSTSRWRCAAPADGVRHPRNTGCHSDATIASTAKPRTKCRRCRERAADAAAGDRALAQPPIRRAPRARRWTIADTTRTAHRLRRWTHSAGDGGAAGNSTAASRAPPRPCKTSDTQMPAARTPAHSPPQRYRHRSTAPTRTRRQHRAARRPTSATSRRRNRRSSFRSTTPTAPAGCTGPAGWSLAVGYPTGRQPLILPPGVGTTGSKQARAATRPYKPVPGHDPPPPTPGSVFAHSLQRRVGESDAKPQRSPPLQHPIECSDAAPSAPRPHRRAPPVSFRVARARLGVALPTPALGLDHLSWRLLRVGTISQTPHLPVHGRVGSGDTAVGAVSGAIAAVVAAVHQTGSSGVSADLAGGRYGHTRYGRDRIRGAAGAHSHQQHPIGLSGGGVGGEDEGGSPGVMGVTEGRPSRSRRQRLVTHCLVCYCLVSKDAQRDLSHWRRVPRLVDRVVRTAAQRCRSRDKSFALWGQWGGTRARAAGSVEAVVMHGELARRGHGEMAGEPFAYPNGEMVSFERAQLLESSDDDDDDDDDEEEEEEEDGMETCNGKECRGEGGQEGVADTVAAAAAGVTAKRPRGWPEASGQSARVTLGSVAALQTSPAVGEPSSEEPTPVEVDRDELLFREFLASLSRDDTVATPSALLLDDDDEFDYAKASLFIDEPQEEFREDAAARISSEEMFHLITEQRRRTRHRHSPESKRQRRGTDEEMARGATAAAAADAQIQAVVASAGTVAGAAAACTYATAAEHVAHCVAAAGERAPVARRRRQAATRPRDGLDDAVRPVAEARRLARVPTGVGPSSVWPSSRHCTAPTAGERRAGVAGVRRPGQPTRRAAARVHAAGRYRCRGRVGHVARIGRWRQQRTGLDRRRRRAAGAVPVATRRAVARALSAVFAASQPGGVSGAISALDAPRRARQPHQAYHHAIPAAALQIGAADIAPRREHVWRVLGRHSSVPATAPRQWMRHRDRRRAPRRRTGPHWSPHPATSSRRRSPRHLATAKPSPTPPRHPRPTTRCGSNANSADKRIANSC